MSSPRNLASVSANPFAPASAIRLAEPAAKNGRPEVLDQSKRAYVCRLIGMGYSRRMAARQAQCSHTTIARTAARDPLFALDLANAETEVDGEALRVIRGAAREQKYWRAAAWLLERRNPEEYGRRTAHAFSGDQVMAMLAQTEEEEGVSCQVCPNRQESSPCTWARNVLSDNDLCKRQTFAPSAENGEAVQKSGPAAAAGGPPRPFLSVR